MASLVKRSGIYYVAWREGKRQRRQSLDTRNEKEAKRRLHIWERKWADNEWSGQPRDYPVKEFWSKYLKWITTNRAPATVEVQSVHWQRYLDEFHPVMLSDVSRGQVEDLKRQWIEAGRKPATINGFLKDLRTIYNKARMLEFPGEVGAVYAGPNPFEKIERVPNLEEKRAMTPAQTKALLKAAADQSKADQADNIHLVIALLAYGGLRKGEVDAAEWSWFDFKAKTITIPAAVTKTRKRRVLPLAKKLAAILKPYREESGHIYRSAHDSGGRYRCDFRKSFDSVRKKAGLQWVTPHTLRHSWATNLLKAGVPIAKVSKWIGHSSIAITADVYGHIEGHDPDIDKL